MGRWERNTRGQEGLEDKRRHLKLALLEARVIVKILLHCCV